VDTHAVLGVVGKDYTVFENKYAFDFMDCLVGDKLAMFETAGSLKGGRKVWMLARIPKEYRAGPEDLIKPYVLLVNSFDGSTALRMLPTTVRVVCQNTLNLALRDGVSGITIRHSSSLDERVKEARLKLGVIAARFDAFDEELHAMLDAELTARQVNRYFNSLLPAVTDEMSLRGLANRRVTLENFKNNFEDDTNTLPGVKGTVWAAYNAVSEWADHQRKFRGVDDVARAESRLESVWFGGSHEFKTKAYESALELVA
jgi:phage/plasmid-like protein (TIGR03299 family)